MLIEAITEGVVGAVAERGLAALMATGMRRPRFKTSKTGRQRRAAALQSHLVGVAKWSSEISFRELWRAKALAQSFVDLDLEIGLPAKGRPAQDVRLRVTDLRRMSESFLIFGEPGAGKTTSLKRIAAQEIADGLAHTPVLVRLREVRPNETLYDTIQGLLALEPTGYPDARAATVRREITRLLAAYLDGIDALLLLDGLDEVDEKARQDILEEVEELLKHVSKTRILLTSRVGAVRRQLPHTRSATLRDLSRGQVRQFAVRWLGASEAESFLSQMYGNPYYGTMVRPLTLAHLCAIYERTGAIPEKPRSVYKKIVRIFLSEWDEERGVRRASRYAGFTVDRKEEFLEALAFRITSRLGRTTFRDHELAAFYVGLHADFGLPKNEAEQVAAEVETHTGLLLQTGEDQYEFAHKSLQEYLAASYIVRLPGIPNDPEGRLANELAVAVALSSKPSEYLWSVARSLADSKATRDYCVTFLTRLLTERVDFSQGEALGAAAIVIRSLTCYSEITWRTPHETFPSVDALMSLPAVAASLARVLEESVVRSHFPGVAELTWPVRFGGSPKEPAAKRRAFIDEGLLAIAGGSVSLGARTRIEAALRGSRDTP
ncbi:MAG: hypothetical protein AMXMBFR53_19810 [Gemmatimonadota bacterium]